MRVTHVHNRHPPQTDNENVLLTNAHKSTTLSLNPSLPSLTPPPPPPPTWIKLWSLQGTDQKGYVSVHGPVFCWVRLGQQVSDGSDDIASTEPLYDLAESAWGSKEEEREGRGKLTQKPLVVQWLLPAVSEAQLTMSLDPSFLHPTCQ